MVDDHHINSKLNGSTSVPIIEDGCVLGEQKQSTEILEYGNGQEIRFSSKVFVAAPGFQQAYIVCNVLFCDRNSCPKRECGADLPNGNNPNPAGRRKRAIQQFDQNGLEGIHHDSHMS